jgi:CheY-like chemotaxis protein
VADERLRKAQKLESLGLMAGGIAHDFNNLLTGILGNADIALSHLAAGDPAREFVEQVLSSSQLAAELTRQIQAYSGSSPFEVRPMDVSEELRRRSELLHTALGERLTLELDLADDLPTVEADPTQFAQVVMNLILNASEACGEELGRVRIATGLMQVEAPTPVPVTGTLDPGTYVFVEVADTGHGVDDSIRDQLFDPFFTTRETGRGLGLSVVHGVVTMLRGAITVDSTPEKGALFRLFLPTTPREIQGDAPPTPALVGRDRILVLDDNAAVLGFVREALERYGYRVFTANNGQQAEDLMAEHRSEIAMVLLDAVLPGETSELILDRLRRVRPNVPVLLMSGYAEAEAMTRFARSSNIAGFLSKPFRSETLAARVREALDGVSTPSDR